MSVSPMEGYFGLVLLSLIFSPQTRSSHFNLLQLAFTPSATPAT